MVKLLRGFFTLVIDSLSLTALWANSAKDKLVIFFSYFFQMNCQILFFGKNKKNISICRLLKILPKVLSVKHLEVKKM